MLGLILSITAFWLAIHFFKRYWGWGRDEINNNNGETILPLTRPAPYGQRAPENTRADRTTNWPWGIGGGGADALAGRLRNARTGTKVTVNKLSLKIETTAFNSVFDFDSAEHRTWSSSSSTPSSSSSSPSTSSKVRGRVKTLLRWGLGFFYDVGSFVCVVAMMGVLGMCLAWGFVIVLKWVWMILPGGGSGWGASGDGSGSVDPGQMGVLANATTKLLERGGYQAIAKRAALSGAGVVPPEAMDGDLAASARGSTHPLQLLIPGYTVPSSHFIPLILALLVAQVIHEGGHLLAAKLSSIHPISTGLSLIFILPSAFVALPTTALAQLTPSKRMRIICAGAWHNLALWNVLGMLGLGLGFGLNSGRSGMGEGTILSRVGDALGFEDIASVGVVVTDISQDSPLAAYLPLGSLVTHLDDFSLGFQPNRSSTIAANPDSSIDRWITFLTGWGHAALHSPIADGVTPLGWCIPPTLLSEHGQECCQEGYQAAPPLKHLSCFRGLHLPDEDCAKLGTGHCLDPVQIFSSEPRKRRCGRDEDCASDRAAEGAESKCLVLEKKEQILRIGYVLPPFLQRNQGDQEEKALLWSGPKVEVYEQVVVGTTLPRTKLGLFILRQPVYWFDIFINYLQMITLSLFIFNLLPITVLDGGHLLELLLDEFILVLFRVALGRGRKRDDDEPDFVELEELESGGLSRSRSSPLSRDQEAGERRKTKDVLKLVNYGVIGMALLVMVDAFLGGAG